MSTEHFLPLLRFNVKIVPSKLPNEVIDRASGFLHPFPLPIFMKHLSGFGIAVCCILAVSVTFVTMEENGQSIFG